MTRGILQAAILLALVGWTCLRIFSGLHEPVARWDEHTNISVVQETKDRKSFPILYYKGQPFFEKPPLWYMLAGVFTTSQETSVFAMRGISIISALLIIGVSIAFLYSYFGFLAMVIAWTMLLLSHQLFQRNPAGIFSTHTLVSADPDSLQIFFLLVSFAVGASKKRWAIALCGLAAGLAVLSKGPLGFVPLIALTILRKPTFYSWLVAFFIILPWYALMTFQFGQAFIESHIVRHLLQRVAFPLEGHHGAPWYYLKILTDLRVYPVFPVVLLSLFLLKKLPRIPFLIRYCGLVASLLLVVPSFSGTKLAWYILPLYPFLALLTGMVAAAALRKHSKESFN